MSTPSFNLTYYNPYEIESSAERYDSYINFIKQTKLHEYNAQLVGSYIQNTVERQTETISRNFDFLNQSLTDIYQTSIDTNILLGEISKLLQLPDKEKERILHIERGLKFYKQSKFDLDIAIDAKNEFEKALNLYEQDWFVLQHLGMIYLYKENIVDTKKAKEYFLKAAKYSLADYDSQSLKKVNEYFNIELSYRYSNSINGNDTINFFIRECYLNAAFCSYIEADYQDAHQIINTALSKIQNDIKLLFFSAKYATRIGENDFALSQIQKMIEYSESMALSVYGDTELSENKLVKNFIENFIEIFESKFIIIDSRLKQIKSLIKNQNVLDYLEDPNKSTFLNRALIFKKQPFLFEEIEDDIGINYNNEVLDPLFYEGARIIVECQMGSVTLLQRRLKIGLNRATRLINKLEEAGIIGPNNGPKAREVRVLTVNQLEEIIVNFEEKIKLNQSLHHFKICDILDKWEEIKQNLPSNLE
ncbi:MAG: hypothetical protein HYI21_00310 [Sediminibacterium sp. Gen4]|jgi:tetratricopeptide (TPR) repeat protein|uniref:DNA translocase FtsK n=1 Tax=unclassified Sediminibacterium TaxID=2635961 RepID=UPI0015B93C58|nr:MULTISPECIES: DNA translocase FtsK [unclassified Sediminibacterium]MBW0164994.1 hypothetical protein [Sediminibacterium sp.]NWK64449.1 hypothetical protein [Sediminibacterium sp. Gen4]